jgi:hypothetical protein
MLPFTATTMPLLPVEAFPTEQLRARAAKLPMWDQDREMAIMRIQSQREYLGRLQRLAAQHVHASSTHVQGVHEAVPLGVLTNRFTRLHTELAWEEALIVRNDLLLAAAQ